jgi:SET family sugar efflux transporter-like MFS transporter
MTFQLFWRKMIFVFNIPGFLPLVGITLLLGMAYAFVFPFLSLFGVEAVGMTPLQLGLFMSLGSVGAVLIGTYIGRVSDIKFGRKWVLLLTTVFGIAGYLAMLFFRDYYILLFNQIVIVGIASAAMPQMFAYTREIMTRSKLDSSDMPFAMNMMRMFFSLAWVVGPAIGGMIKLHFDFTGLFVSSLIGYVLVLLSIIFFLKEERSEDEGRSDIEEQADQNNQAAAKKDTISLKQFLARPFIFFNVLAFTFIFTTSTMAFINLPLFMKNTLGGTDTHVGIMFSIAPIFEIPFMLYLGILVSRWKQSVLIQIGAGLFFAYHVLALLVQEPWHIYPLQILWAIFISIFMGIAISYFQDFLPNEPGTATTLYTNTNHIGAMIGGVAAGAVAEAFGYRAVFLACAIITGLAWLLLMRFGTDKGEHPAKQPRTAQTTSEN